jgi:hypothetical protein
MKSFALASIVAVVLGKQNDAFRSMAELCLENGF